jgi:hypothetical protein
MTTTWKVKWQDGSETPVPKARGHKDALRRAMQTTRRMDYVEIEKRSGGEFVYRLTTWRVK